MERHSYRTSALGLSAVNWGATALVAERPEFDFIFPTLGAMAEMADL